MGIRTSIEYCDSTTNPVPGCSGCELYSSDPEENHCYAATLINRYIGLKGWPPSFTKPTHFPYRLPAAIKWPDLTGTERPDKPWLNGMPRIIFVNDLGDLFAPAAPDPWETLAPHLEAMTKSPHIYLILTKWPENMIEFLYDYYALSPGEDIPQNVLWGTTITGRHTFYRLYHLLRSSMDGDVYVLRGLRRWLSLEPLLGALEGMVPSLLSMPDRSIDWVVTGGESGFNARPSRPDWFRAVRDDCQAAGVPFFFKQWGDADPGSGCRANAAAAGWKSIFRRGGRILDGQKWSQVPSFPVET